MKISGILYAVAALLFLLAAFGASLGDVNIVALGLTLVAAGLAVSALGLGGRGRGHGH